MITICYKLQVEQVPMKDSRKSGGDTTPSSIKPENNTTGKVLNFICSFVFNQGFEIFTNFIFQKLFGLPSCVWISDPLDKVL